MRVTASPVSLLEDAHLRPTSFVIGSPALNPVMPAQAGIHDFSTIEPMTALLQRSDTLHKTSQHSIPVRHRKSWMPACAGMTRSGWPVGQSCRWFIGHAVLLNFPRHGLRQW